MLQDKIESMLQPVYDLQEKLYRLSAQCRQLNSVARYLSPDGINELSQRAKQRIAIKQELIDRHMFNRDLKTTLKVLRLLNID